MSQLDDLKDRVREDLPNLDRVIGWGVGFDPLHATPLFIREGDDVDRLIWSPLCVHNLTTYLTGLPGKTGVVVKGCDSRSIVELLQENLLDRDKLVVYGLPCPGVIDPAKVRKGVDDRRVVSISFINDRLSIEADGQSYDLEMRELLAQKCFFCRYPNPVIYDHLIGDPREPEATAGDPYPDLQELEAMSTQERFDYWQAQMDRCIRCYACRNACPMCVCRDFCIAESRDPHWLSQETEVPEKWMFQVVHALHLAGRCTECGECERACPMNIPILAFKRKLNKEINELFDYEAGVDPDAKPPLYTFQVEEAKINERGW